MGWLIWVYQFFCVQLLLLYSQSFAKLCFHDQSYALLQFKQLFSFRNSSSSYCNEIMVPSYPKMISWKEDDDCCSWDGVTCDPETGHVIGLDLSCSWLLGNVPSNSSLFLLPQLQKLNLAYNDFNHSQISSSFNRFLDLTLLNLSSSGFYGQLPLEISHLSKLVSLDLSYNFLSLETPLVEGLVQNLTKLKEFVLDYVDMTTISPGILTNLSSSLTSLSLTSCGLQGNLPDSIFHQPNLQILNMALNTNLTGHFPKVNWSNPLKFLDVSNTSLSGELSNVIDNLISLRHLNLRNCSFVGSVPASLGNITKLTFLDLSFNNFSGHIPASLSNLEILNVLRLSSNHFIGEIPNIFVNLTQLSLLSFQSNHLVGPIPFHGGRLQNLAHFSLFGNLISGFIPSWLFTLPRVEYIDLGYNQLSGHIVEFQSRLLQYLYLDSNKLHGSIPILPSQLKIFLISNNNLRGKIPHSICNMSSIQILDLYNNNLRGTLPECIGNLSNSLQVFDLQKNRFYGKIPDTFPEGNHLRTLNFNDNGLEGSVPRSLVNCTMLEVLDVGNNNINDTFPYWLGGLPKLQVLVLRSNKLYGFVSDSSKTRHSFTKLRIFDISNNNFSGVLPEKCFTNLKAMINFGEPERTLQYMGDGYYQDSVIITLKGFDMELIKITTTFTAIDFSNNNFDGKIPEVIENFHALQFLNLSQNNLIGSIPSSLQNLTSLESLDLSSNKLCGEIPWQLTSLNFLQVLNLSQNQLTGPIPQAPHFDTFPNSSYSGNLGLCGFPLSNKCSDDNIPQHLAILEDETETESADGFGWKVVLVGYGCGLFFGMTIGYVVFSIGKPKWLLETFEGKHHRRVRRSNNKRRGRNSSN